MRIVHLSTYDMVGGAARAAYRLHHGLLRRGVDSVIQVQTKSSEEKQILGPANDYIKFFNLARPALEGLPLAFYPRRRDSPFSMQWLPGLFQVRTEAFKPDVVHLHWICRGFKSVASLAGLTKPIVWTFHDMWAFTGGCHLAGSCERYKYRCGHCPVLGSHLENDATRWTWKRKRKFWSGLNLTIVAPSRWMATCVKESSLFQDRRVEVIPNGIDTARFKPVPRDMARDILGLPKGRRLILFGAIGATSDPNKGFQYLKPAIDQLEATPGNPKVSLLIFGASEPENPPIFKFPAHYLGSFHDDAALTLLYSAADVMVVPSRMENLCQTAIEAMACGTPVVAFRTSGLADVVDHLHNGYLARPYEPEDLAKGIECILASDNAARATMERHARNKVKASFDLEVIAKKHNALYRELI